MTMICLTCQVCACCPLFPAAAPHHPPPPCAVSTTMCESCAFTSGPCTDFCCCCCRPHSSSSRIFCKAFTIQTPALLSQIQLLVGQDLLLLLLLLLLSIVFILMLNYSPLCSGQHEKVSCSLRTRSAGSVVQTLQVITLHSLTTILVKSNDVTHICV